MEPWLTRLKKLIKKCAQTCLAFSHPPHSRILYSQARMNSADDFIEWLIDEPRLGIFIK